MDLPFVPKRYLLAGVLSIDQATNQVSNETRNSRRPLTRRSLLKKGLAGLSAGLVVDAFAIEPNLVSIEKARIPFRNLPEPFEGYRIVQLSDFHCGPWIDPYFVQEVAKLSVQQNPDLIVITGDFVEGHARTHLPDLNVQLSKLNAPDGVLGVLGNHDGWRSAPRVLEKIDAVGTVQMLVNSNKVIEREGKAISIVGLADLWTGQIDLEKAYKNVPEEFPVILLQHNPDYAEDMNSSRKVDLQLAGHTHGGQFRTPWGWSPRVPSKYGTKFLEGLVKGKHHSVFVNRGIGGVVPFHPRLLCWPQISVLELTSAVHYS